jgi:hypothetical protein
LNRVIAVAATAVTATMAAAVAIVPAMAAPRPAAAHPAAHARIKAAAEHARTTAQRATTTSALPTEIASELDGGKYVTIVHCQGVDSPPPVHLGSPGTPLIVNGVGPSAAVFKMLKQQDPYKNVYTCTVLVKEKVPGKAKPAVPKKVAAHKAGCEIATGAGRTCTKKVTLNTGFGGLARQVRNHHPAG